MSDCFEDKETPAPTSSPPESEAAAPPKPKKKPCPCSKTACLHVPASEEYQLQTPGFDPRFPNQNQTKRCYVNFLDYHRCIKANGCSDGACECFKRVYTSLCPNEWVKKWNEQIENGTFAGKID